jgi:hypothetical protein
LAIANIVRRGMPMFNAMAITTMVDRWRPVTHSFHLLCSEMMVTIEDVAMIVGLPIRGRPINSGLSHPRGVRELLGSLVGRRR